MIVINIARDFSITPGARTPDQGLYSGEELRNLIEKHWDEDLIRLELDGVAGYAACFLDEVFYRLAQKYGVQACLHKLEFITEDVGLQSEIYLNMYDN